MTFLDYLRKYGPAEGEKRWLKNEKNRLYYQVRKDQTVFQERKNNPQ